MEYSEVIVEHVILDRLPYYNVALLLFYWLLNIVFTVSHRRNGGASF
ncbi:MAG: hypothetical protein V7742_01805 [Halioglobus sp.]